MTNSISPFADFDVRTFLEEKFGRTLVSDVGEIAAIFKTFDKSKPSTGKMVGKTNPVKSVATRKLIPGLPSTDVFHEIVLPKSVNVNDAHRYAGKGYYGEKDPTYLSCVWGKNAEYDSSSGKYVAPKSFIKLYQGFIDAAYEGHEIYSALIKSTTESASAQGDADFNARLAEARKILWKYPRNLPTLKILKKQLKESGDTIPSSIWTYVAITVDRVRRHFREINAELNGFDLKALRKSFEDQKVNNARLATTSLISRIESKHYAILEKNEDVIVFNETGAFENRCDAAIARQTTIKNKELLRNGYWADLTWATFRNALFPHSHGNKIRSACQNHKKAKVFLSKVCRADRMDANGNVSCITSFVSPQDVVSELAKLKEAYPKLELYKSEGIFYNIYKGNQFAKHKRRSRTEHQLAMLCNLFTDVDLKDSGLINGNSTEEEVEIAKEYILRKLEPFCAENNIPFPSTITDSGGGFHMRWNFDKPIERKNNKWEKITYTDSKGKTVAKSSGSLFDEMQKKLHDIFRHIGADDRALDKVRLLRPAGYENHKRGRITKHVFPEDGGEVNLYSFADLAGCLSRPTVETTCPEHEMVIANFIQNSVALRTEKIKEEAEQELKTAKTTRAKRAATKRLKNAEKDAIDFVKTSLFRRQAGFNMEDLDQATLEKAISNYLEYRKSASLPGYREESCKGFVDNTNYKQRLKDLLGCGRYMADIDNQSVGGETGLMGEGNRNHFVLWAFQLYGNAHRDDARHYGSRRDRDVAAFMQRAYDAVFDLLVQMGIGKQWLIENYDKALGYSDDGSDETRGVYNNMASQLGHFWETGHIINANASDRTNYANDVACIKDDEDKLVKYTRSPLGKAIKDGVVSESVAKEGLFPHLGYTASVERIMRDCGITDDLAFKAGSRTLYTEATRSFFQGEWKKYLGNAVREFEEDRVEGNNAKLPEYVKREGSSVISAALRKTRSETVKLLANKLGYTEGAVNTVARTFAKTGFIPAAYKENKLNKYLALIKLLDHDIALADQGKDLQDLSPAVDRARTWLTRVTGTHCKVEYLSSVFKSAANEMGSREVWDRARDYDPVPIAA